MTSILVVEDEAVVARDLEATLTRLGYTVPGIAALGEDAVAKAAQLHPDLVLMDIHLKGKLDGIEAAGVLRERMSLPVVYLTAFCDDRTLERARETQPYSFLLKPFSEMELKTAIETAIYKHSSEQQLRQRFLRIESTLDALGEAVISADSYGRITVMNAAAAELTGWRIDEAIGQPLSRICSIERTREDTPAGVRSTEALRSERTTCVLKTRHGRRVLVEHSLTSVVDDNQMVVGIVMTLRDVTEQRYAQEEVAISDRLSAITALIDGISDEINNPLAYVVANIDFALEDLAAIEGWLPDESGNAQDVKYTPSTKLKPLWTSLSQAGEGAQRIRRVVSDLRSFSRPTTADHVEIDLATVLTSAAMLARPDVEKRARFHVKIGALPHVQGSELRLVQAFASLLRGAAGSFTISGSDDHEIRLEAYTDELKHAVVVVTDNGAPMDPKEHKHLFEPFFSRAGGSHENGLALWICHRVLLEHGAQIHVTSEGERGNRYTVVMEQRRIACIQEN